MTSPNSTKFEKGSSGERSPKSAIANDTSGERKGRLVGGVPIGKADTIGEREKGHMGKIDGLLGEVKGGRRDGSVYDHKRIPHAQDSM